MNGFMCFRQEGNPCVSKTAKSLVAETRIKRKFIYFHRLGGIGYRNSI
jgi:hypothetical protein